MSSDDLAALLVALVPAWFLLSRLRAHAPDSEVRQAYGRAFVLGLLSGGPVGVCGLFARAWLPEPKAELLIAAQRAFVHAALPEETFKLIAVIFVLRSFRALERPTVWLHAGILVGLGFAVVENLVYVAASGLPTALVRAVSAVPCHAFLGAVMGFYVGAYRQTQRPSLLAKAWLVPLVLHGLYNLPLLSRYKPAFDDGAGAVMLSALVLALLALWTRQLALRLASPE